MHFLTSSNHLYVSYIFKGHLHWTNEIHNLSEWNYKFDENNDIDKWKFGIIMEVTNSATISSPIVWFTCIFKYNKGKC